MKYKRLLIKFSGETLKGKREYGIDDAMLSLICNHIKRLVENEYEIGIVIGGGNIFRGIQGAAKGFDRIMGDYVGMLATVFNSIFIAEKLKAMGIKARVLSGLSIPQVVEDFHPIKAKEYLKNKEVLVFGGGTGNPYFTTDTAAALRAIEIGADLLIKGTKVSGVYTDNPLTNPQSKKLDFISFSEYLEKNLKVMDNTAVSLCRDNNLPILVLRFDIEKQDDIVAFLRGEKIGSIIGGDEVC